MFKLSSFAIKNARENCAVNFSNKAQQNALYCEFGPTSMTIL